MCCLVREWSDKKHKPEGNQSSEGPAAGPYRYSFEFSKALDERHRLRNHCEQLSLFRDSVSSIRPGKCVLQTTVAI